LSEHVSSAWYADFFTELPNEFWRRAVPPEATTAEIDFVEQRLGLAPGSRVVDVPCGSGRHSIALAERGHTVTGLDISAEAIEHARRTAKAAGVDVDFRLAEMREVPPDGFDAAVCMGNSFGYLDPEGTRTFVAALAAAVRPGGGLRTISGMPLEPGDKAPAISLADQDGNTVKLGGFMRNYDFDTFEFRRVNQTDSILALPAGTTLNQVTKLLTGFNSGTAPEATADSIPSCFPVSSTIGNSGRAARARRASSTPDIPGIRTSVITASQGSPESM